MIRHISGEVELPDGSEVKYGIIRARAVGVMPVDALTDAITMAVSTDLIIEDGSVNGDLAVPCEYEVTVLAADGRTVLLPPFRVGIPEGSGTLTFGQLYLTANTAPDFPDPVVRVGGEILRLGTMELEPDRLLRPDGEGGIVWAEEVAPSWDDLLGKPTTFPPEIHVHTITDVTDLQAVLDTEAAERAIADQNLQEQIDAEAVTRSSADAQNQADLTGHTTSPAPHAGRVVQTSPQTEANNRIQGASSGFPILELLRHASSTDADLIFSVLNASGSTVLFGVTTSGRIGLGGAPSSGSEWLVRLNGGGISLDAGNRIREQTLGTDAVFSPSGAAGVRLLPTLQINGTSAATATLEAFSAAANRVILALRLASAQTSNVIEVRSADGATLYYAVTPTGQIQHAGGIVSTGGNARGAGATDLQTFRSIASQVASGANAVISGGTSNTASGSWATIPGGEANVANAGSLPSFAWGRATNCSHGYSACFGDYVASRWGGAITIGLGRTTSGAGETQGHIGASGVQTSDETPVTLRSLVVPAQSTIKLRGDIVARRASGGSDIATWSFRVTATRDVSGPVSIVSSSFIADDPGPGYTAGVVADSGNQAVRFTAAGLAGHNVRWTILFTAAEVFY